MKSVADLQVGPSFTASDGVMYQIRSSKSLVEQLTEEHRERWRQAIRDATRLIVDYHPTQDYIAELQFTAFFGGKPEEGLLRRRHDGYVRSMARFFAMALSAGKPYNPEAEKRRGDSFDLELLQALAVPALICTLDDRLRTHVRETGSPQARQLLSPMELVEGTAGGTLQLRF